MWISIQASASCPACGETTAVNAATERMRCTGCGATMPIAVALWEGALSDARATVEQIGSNVTTNRSFDAGGTELTIALCGEVARCPHCEAEWAETPGEGCPACGHDVLVRALGAHQLVGEDPGAVGGAIGERVAQTITCSGCGGALPATGEARGVTCGHCGRDTVVPDAVWRRIHAPSAVARWYLRAEGVAAKPVAIRVHGALAADDDRVYVLGQIDHAAPFSLIALDRRTRTPCWSVDLQRFGIDMGGLTLRDGELVAWSLVQPETHAFDPATGRSLGTRPGLSGPMRRVAADPDGSLLVDGIKGLQRVGADGQASALWPPAGCLGRLFDRRPRELSQHAFGHDGDLRGLYANRVLRLDPTGATRWSLDVSGVNVAIVPPAAARDGTTWVVFRTVGGTMTVEQMLEPQSESTSALIRIDADGKRATVVRESGYEEFNALAVTPDGAVWVADLDGRLFHLDADGKLLAALPTGTE